MRWTATTTIDEDVISEITLSDPEQTLPPEIVDAISRSLIEAPADLTLEGWASRVRAAIPFGTPIPTDLIPTIASAIRTSLISQRENPERIGSFTRAEVARRTRDWPTLPWRIIPPTPLSTAENLAIDEWLSDRVGRGESGPILRMWDWSESAIVLGRCQSLRNEVDLSEATSAGMTIGRRISGGGTMVIPPGGAITYSLYLPEDLVAGMSIRQSYEVCDAWVIIALRTLGIPAHHVPVNDLACPQGKIGGAAQARRRRTVLHHTTLAYDLDERLMARVLRIGRPRVSERSVTSAPKVVAPLTMLTSESREAVMARLIATFRDHYGGTEEPLHPEERAAIAPLAHDKYAGAEWIHDVP